MPQFEPFHRALKGDDQKLPFLINAVTQQHPPRKSCSTNSLSVFRSSITEDGVAGPKLIGTIGIFNLAGRLRFKSVGEVADEDEGEQSEQLKWQMNYLYGEEFQENMGSNPRSDDSPGPAPMPLGANMVASLITKLVLS
nr:hypothetical protein Iba_chr08fCG1450 [Ipomoea batatas]